MSKIEFIDAGDAQHKLPRRVQPTKPGFEGISILDLNLNKIDSAWKHDHFSYSGVGGKDRKPERIVIIHEEICKKGKEYMPIIYLADRDPKTIRFADGRHRTAYFHENGYTTIPFIVPKYQAKVIQKFFGHDG